jgi:hypothetical protein
MGQQMDPTALCDFGITRRVSFGIILSPLPNMVDYWDYHVFLVQMMNLLNNPPNIQQIPGTMI